MAIGPDTTPGILVGRDTYFTQELNTVIDRSKIEAATVGSNFINSIHLFLALAAAIEENESYTGTRVYDELQSRELRAGRSDRRAQVDSAKVGWTRFAGKVLDATFDAGDKQHRQSDLRDLANALFQNENVQTSLLFIGMTPEMVKQQWDPFLPPAFDSQQ